MNKTISEIIAEASEAAKLAPEHLQEIAFSKAFDVLTATKTMQPSGENPSRKSSRSRFKPSSDDKVDPHTSLDALDRTAHPEIHHGETGLDNSLRLLRAVRDDLGIDGLTAAEIARVLTDKFRARITRQAVGIALNGAGRYVNRYKEGVSVMFQIMGPGETYLDSLKETGSTAPTMRKKGSIKKAAGKRSAKSNPPKPSKNNSATPSKSKRRVGPDAAVRQLYDGGFFNAPRTIGSIVEECKHGHGRTYRSNEISPVLLRYLRNGDLNRNKNKDNQYEYSKP